MRFSLAVLAGLLYACGMSPTRGGDAPMIKDMMGMIHEEFLKDGSLPQGPGGHERKLSRHRGLSMKGNELVVEISCKANVVENLKETLDAINGVTVTACEPDKPVRRCSAWLNMEQYEDIQTILCKDDKCRIDPSATKLTQRGSVVNEAYYALKVDLVRSVVDPNLTGAGMKIGFLTDSFNLLGGYADDIASGDLPSDVIVLKEWSGEGVDEGRAALQLIHDLVPDAKLYFRTALGGSQEFAQGIRDLANAGVNVIGDSMTYLTQPFFQNGIIAQAADDIAKLQGVPYFSSIGNQGSDSWEGVFTPTPSRLRISSLVSGLAKPNCLLHDFGNGTVFQSVTFVRDETRFVFQWEDPFGNAARDVDLHAFGTSGNYIGGITRDDVGGDPMVFVSVTGTLRLVFCLNSGTFSGSDLRIKWISYDDVTNVDHFTFSSTNTGQKNAAYTAAVGAVDFQRTPVFGTPVPLLESFSSHGGTPILFYHNGTRLKNPEIRKQPRFVSVDGVKTTFFGNLMARFPSGLGKYFFGTSAAAPNAAAVGLILLQINPNLTPIQVYNIMEQSAIDMNETGFDFTSGYGLIDAEAAVRLLQSQTPNVTSSSPSFSSSVSFSQSPSPSPLASNCSESFTCNGSCGNCYEARQPGEIGCECETCECKVCEADSFCCEVRWDGFCVAAAKGMCNGCGSSLGPSLAPAPGCSESFACNGSCGNCYEARQPGEIGCECETCECKVCEADSFCCEVRWDVFCVDTAKGLCNGCDSSLEPSLAPSRSPPTPAPGCSESFACNGSCGNCFEARKPGEIGCECETCECKVCEVDPVCCDAQWDGWCVAAAKGLCNGCSSSAAKQPSSAPAGGTCQESWECEGGTCGDCGRYSIVPGCGCDGCECVVCELDSFCCDTQWDRICARLAQEHCNCTTVPPTHAPSAVPSGVLTRPPTEAPSPAPSSMPTGVPTEAPSRSPTEPPSVVPSGMPSSVTSQEPSLDPTLIPTQAPETFTCTNPCQCENCFFARRSPGCLGTGGCTSCGQQVCLELSECCDVAWTQACGDKAKQVCTCCI